MNNLKRERSEGESDVAVRDAHAHTDGAATDGAQPQASAGPAINDVATAGRAGSDTESDVGHISKAPKRTESVDIETKQLATFLARKCVQDADSPKDACSTGKRSSLTCTSSATEQGQPHGKTQVTKVEATDGHCTSEVYSAGSRPAAKVQVGDRSSTPSMKEVIDVCARKHILAKLAGLREGSWSDDADEIMAAQSEVRWILESYARLKESNLQLAQENAQLKQSITRLVAHTAISNAAAQQAPLRTGSSISDGSPVAASPTGHGQQMETMLRVLLELKNRSQPRATIDSQQQSVGLDLPYLQSLPMLMQQQGLRTQQPQPQPQLQQRQHWQHLRHQPQRPPPAPATSNVQQILSNLAPEQLRMLQLLLAMKQSGSPAESPPGGSQSSDVQQQQVNVAGMVQQLLSHRQDSAPSLRSQQLPPHAAHARTSRPPGEHGAMSSLFEKFGGKSGHPQAMSRPATNATPSRQEDVAAASEMSGAQLLTHLLQRNNGDTQKTIAMLMALRQD